MDVNLTLILNSIYRKVLFIPISFLLITITNKSFSVPLSKLNSNDSLEQLAMDQWFINLSRQSDFNIDSINKYTKMLDQIINNSNSLKKMNEQLEAYKLLGNENLYLYYKEQLLIFETNYNKEKSIKGFKKLIDEIGFTKDPIKREIAHMALTNLRMPYRTSAFLQDGINYYLQRADSYEKIHDSDRVSTCCYVLRGFYSVQGLMDKAIYYQEKSIAFLHPDKLVKWEIDNPNLGVKGVINRNAVLASIYTEIGQPKKALSILYKVVPLLNKYKDSIYFFDEPYVYMQIVNAKFELNEDSILYYIKKAETVEHADLTYMPYFFLQRGRYYLMEKMFDSALIYFRNCRELRKEWKMSAFNAQGIFNPNYYLAKLNFEKNRFSDAIYLLEEEVKIFKEANLRRAALTEMELLANCYIKINQNGKAAQVLNEIININKALALEETQNRTATYQTEKIIAEGQKTNFRLMSKAKQETLVRNIFILGTILLSLFIIIIIYNSRLKRKIELEQIRNRLSRDLHDDIGSTLSSINILSRNAQRNAQVSDDEKTKETLEKINERSQRLLSNMSDIIWNINPENDTVDEMLSRMREYATTMLEAKNIEYSFHFSSEKTNKLSMDTKSNLYLIFKEAVNNLTKYSGATKASLSLFFEENKIRLVVEDNGQGFNIDEIIHRGGLINMQHRAEELKGELKITSVLKKGTKVELILPRSN